MKKLLNKKFSLFEAQTIYKIFLRKREFEKFKNKELFLKKPFLLLSSLCERDIYSSDSAQFDSLFYFGRILNRKIDKDFKETLNKKQLLALNIGIFLSRKKVSLIIGSLPYLLKSLIKFFFKTILGILDIFFTTLYIINKIFIIRLIKSIFKFNNRKLKKVDEVYSFYFWNSKKEKSIQYYFPDFQERKSKAGFVNIYIEYRLLIIALIKNSNRKDIYSPVDFLNFESLVNSIIQLFKLIFFEIRICKKARFGNLLNLLNFFENINFKYWNLLVYNSAPFIHKILKPKIIYLWHENQIYNRSLALGLSRNFNKFESENCKMISYFGSSYSNKSLPHFTPTQLELETGVWLKNIFMHQDKDSKDEMHKELSRSNFNYEILITRNSLKRFSMTKKSNFYKHKNLKDICFFTHSYPRELYIMIIRFLTEKEFIHLYNLNSNLYIRLHPSINIQLANKQISLAKLYLKKKLPNFIFVNSKKEDISETILSSRHTIFSISSYINLAISLKVNVIALRTSFLYEPPVQKKYEKCKNYKIL